MNLTERNGEWIRMKYAGMPMGMWLLFGGSFRKNLV